MVHSGGGGIKKNEKFWNSLEPSGTMGTLWGNPGGGTVDHDGEESVLFAIFFDRPLELLRLCSNAEIPPSFDWYIRF